MSTRRRLVNRTGPSRLWRWTKRSIILWTTQSEFVLLPLENPNVHLRGTWHFGYGDKFDEAKLKTLPPGSFYTEPPGQPHFAETSDEAVVVQITGFGPSSTEYVDPAQDPRRPRKAE